MFKSFFSCLSPIQRQDAKIATVMSDQYIYDIAYPSLIGKLKNFTSLLKDYGATEDVISTFTKKFNEFKNPEYRKTIQKETALEKRIKLLPRIYATPHRP